MKSNLILFISSLRLPFHIIFLLLVPKSNYFWDDFEKWKEILLPEKDRNKTILSFIKLMTTHQEFRNLFHYRMGFFSIPLKIFCKPIESLYINCEDIGPGLFIQHGFSTVISARKMGKNCWVNQQVTIGFSAKGDVPPQFGDNCKISCGAKVLGPLNIGHNVKIGANAVVVKDVPNNVTVVGIPARIVTREGERVDETL
jgi:serine O-acetyltransferase